MTNRKEEKKIQKTTNPRDPASIRRLTHNTEDQVKAQKDYHSKYDERWWAAHQSAKNC